MKANFVLPGPGLVVFILTINKHKFRTLVPNTFLRFA